MSAAVEEKLYTPEDLLTLPDGQGYELVAGRLVEKPVGTESSLIGGLLFARLLAFSVRHGLGWVLPEGTSYQCFSWLPGQVRRADVSFIRRERLREVPRGHTLIPPDLAVEIVSPRDLAEELEAKVEDYLRAGVRLVWVIQPASRVAHVYRLDGSTTRLHEDDSLDGEEVLPGFRCRLSDALNLEPGTEVFEGGRA